jgi:branched-chain amino acid transport system substrate-binding protein
MPRSVRCAGAVAALAAALTLSACGARDSDAVRIGVLADCTGGLGAFRDVMLAAAELPLLERGARLAGSKPSDGVARAQVAGKPVELVLGCSEWSTYRVLIAEARRLVEKERVAIVVGPGGDADGLVLRELARRYPDISFVPAESRAPETTLEDPAPNLFRFQPDAAQLTAGLGSYAYHNLGWRTAAIVAADHVLGWPEVAGFVAEFCALGGRVVARFWTPPAVPLSATLATRIPRHVDGVALMPAIAFVDWSGFVNAYARLHPDTARRLVLGPEALIQKTNRASAARFAPGVVAGDQGEFQMSNASWRRLQGRFAHHFPGILPSGSSPAEYPLVVAYRNAMEAALKGLERADGDPGRLVAELGDVEIDGPTGRIRLDRNRQAVAPVYLSRVERGARGEPVVHTLRVVRNVEQTFGGYFTSKMPPPTRTTPACKRVTPPPWALRS